MAELLAEGKSKEEARRLFLRQSHWSVHTTTGNIPAEDFFGRKFRSQISLIRPSKSEEDHPPVDSNEKRAKFNKGNPVWYQRWDHEGFDFFKRNH